MFVLTFSTAGSSGSFIAMAELAGVLVAGTEEIEVVVNGRRLLRRG